MTFPPFPILLYVHVFTTFVHSAACILMSSWSFPPPGVQTREDPRTPRDPSLRAYRLLLRVTLTLADGRVCQTQRSRKHVFLISFLPASALS